MLASFSNKKIFSTLDCMSSFHQIELTEENKQITAFSVGPNQLFEYCRMPFGLVSASSHFQNYLEDVLKNNCLMMLFCILTIRRAMIG